MKKTKGLKAKMPIYNGRKQDLLPIPETCDNCNSPNVDFVTNAIMYGKSRGDWPYICYCCDCKASVGCHKETRNPLGFMADGETRALRRELHRAFDPLWTSGLMTRNSAYKWLAHELNLEPEYCHISWLTKQQLHNAAILCETHYKERIPIIEERKQKREDACGRYHQRQRRFINKRKRH